MCGVVQAGGDGGRRSGHDHDEVRPELLPVRAPKHVLAVEVQFNGGVACMRISKAQASSVETKVLFYTYRSWRRGRSSRWWPVM